MTRWGSWNGSWLPERRVELILGWTGSRDGLRRWGWPGSPGMAGSPSLSGPVEGSTPWPPPLPMSTVQPKTDFASNPRVIPSAHCPPKTRMTTVGTLRQVRFRGLMHSLVNVKQRSSEFNHSYHIRTKHLRNNHDTPRRKIETTSFRSRQHLLCFTE